MTIYTNYRKGASEHEDRSNYRNGTNEHEGIQV